MRLKDLLKVVDPIVDVDIWVDGDDEEPAFSGSMLDIPWTYLNYKIALPATKENKGELPIYITSHTNDHLVTLPIMVINLMEK